MRFTPQNTTNYLKERLRGSEEAGVVSHSPRWTSTFARACRSAVFWRGEDFPPLTYSKCQAKLKAASSRQVMTSLAKHVLAKTGADVVK